MAIQQALPPNHRPPSSLVVAEQRVSLHKEQLAVGGVRQPRRRLGHVAAGVQAQQLVQPRLDGVAGRVPACGRAREQRVTSALAPCLCSASASSAGDHAYAPAVPVTAGPFPPHSPFPPLPSAHRMGSPRCTSRKVRPLVPLAMGAAVPSAPPAALLPALLSPALILAPCSRSCWISFSDKLRPARQEKATSGTQAGLQVSKCAPLLHGSDANRILYRNSTSSPCCIQALILPPTHPMPPLPRGPPARHVHASALARAHDRHLLLRSPVPSYPLTVEHRNTR